MDNNTVILEKMVEGSLLHFTDDMIKISGAATFEHPFGEAYGKDLVALTAGLEHKVHVTYKIIREAYGKNHVMEWDGCAAPLEYFERDA